MFSHIISDVNVDLELSTYNLDELTELVKQTDQLHLEYEEAKTSLEEINKEIFQNEEQFSIIEKDRLKLMSELAVLMLTKCDLKNKLEDLKNVQQSIEFDLKKYNKMKLSTADVELLALTKKKFIIYKKMLKINFDFSNGANTVIHKGYMYNNIEKKLVYFDFNTNEKTIDEISGILWKKMKMISNKSWKYFDV
ncbi:uncharacterized protein LOC112687278 [Sipha flava]|uniref:Uncharacterized protein LOC112687278 n=1 Tax=Sipha flava TaxID=143950 RepID=A0A8B8FYU1_9HEMI|nr:uncharacterized protein LOC112687278 [Sipha flava]